MFRPSSFVLRHSAIAATLLLATCTPAPTNPTPTTTPAPATHPATRPATRRAAMPKIIPPGPADIPSIRIDRKTAQPNPEWAKRHQEYIELAKKGNIDLYFDGDSITDHWHDQGKNVFAKEFAPWNAANFGIGGERTENLLWRLQNGELDGVHPKAFVIMIGCNNAHGNPPEQIAAGINAIIKTLRDKQPQAHILLLAIFPRGKTADDRDRLANDQVNTILEKTHYDDHVKYLDIGRKFLGPEGHPTLDVMWDYAHPTEKGYQIWADAIKPTLTQWLGKPNP